MHLMEALLCNKKWRNIKKVIVLASNGDRKSSNYHILFTAKNISPIRRSLVVCLCNNQVKGGHKRYLEEFKGFRL